MTKEAAPSLACSLANGAEGADRGYIVVDAVAVIVLVITDLGTWPYGTNTITKPQAILSTGCRSGATDTYIGLAAPQSLREAILSGPWDTGTGLFGIVRLTVAVIVPPITDLWVWKAFARIADQI